MGSVRRSGALLVAGALSLSIGLAGCSGLPGTAPPDPPTDVGSAEHRSPAAATIDFGLRGTERESIGSADPSSAGSPSGAPSGSPSAAGPPAGSRDGDDQRSACDAHRFPDPALLARLR